MSSPSPHSHPVAAQKHEDTPLPYGLIGAVGVVTIIVFALGILWATHILNANLGATQPDVAASTKEVMNKPEIGIVNQRMFELDNRAEEKRDLQQQRLNSYGWVDEQKQVAHIPVERAMELLLSEQKK